MEKSLAHRKYPLPSAMYKTWQDWGKTLVRVLQVHEVPSVLEAPNYHSSNVPTQGKGGDVIYVTDTDKLAYWKVGTSVWRYIDESGNV